MVPCTSNRFPVYDVSFCCEASKGCFSLNWARRENGNIFTALPVSTLKLMDSLVGPRSNVGKARFGEDVPVALTVSME